MTSLIRGRGTGKSTVVEMIRLCLRRGSEIPEQLKAGLERFAQVAETRNGPGGLESGTRLEVTLNRGGDEFRLRWSQDSAGPVIQRRAGNQRWETSPGAVRTRFPVRILSQGQVLSLAGQPEALLRLVDQSDEVGGGAIEARRLEFETRFLSIRSELRALRAKCGMRKRLLGDLEDLNRRIEIIEKGDERNVLIAYRRSQRQVAVFRSRRDELRRSIELIREAADEVEPSDIKARDFSAGNQAEVEALALLETAARAQRDSAAAIRKSAETLAQVADQFGQSFRTSELRAQIRRIKHRDVSLKEGSGDVAMSYLEGFPSLVQRRQAIEGKIRSLDKAQRRVQMLQSEAREGLERLEALRLDLSKRRDEFLSKVLKENQFVRVSLVPFGDSPSLQEADSSESPAREDGRLAREILDNECSEGILAELYQGLSNRSRMRGRTSSGSVSERSSKKS